MKRSMIAVAGVVGVVLLLGTDARAAISIYVSPTGNDGTGDGTFGSPYATIQKGIDMVDVGGTVNVADGTYNAPSSPFVRIEKSLTLTGQSRDGVILDGSGLSTTSWAKGIHTTANNVTIQNLTVQNFGTANYGGYGVLFRDYGHDSLAEGLVAYSNNSVENVKVTASYSSIYSLVNEHLAVKNCVVENSLSDGMFIARASHYATIEGNTVSGSGNHGIWFGNCWNSVAASNNGLIKNNNVSDNLEGGITISDSQSTSVLGNDITGTDPSTFASTFGWDPWAIGALSIMDGSTDITVTDNQIYDNMAAGIGIGTPGGGSTLADISISGNDIHGNDGGVWFRNATATDDITVTYNNLFGNTGSDFSSLDSGGITSTVTADARYNWWGASTGPVVGTNLLFDSPGDNILYEPYATSPIPEPGTIIVWSMLGLVAAGFGVWRRKRAA